MNKQRNILLVLSLVLIGGTAVGMQWLKTNQRLGRPGLKTSPIPGSLRLNVYLPEQVMDYDSVIVPTDTNVYNGLPADTSFMERRYQSPRGDWMDMRVVLMGTDRTSIHKPEFCLTGSGWAIDGAASSEETIHIEQPYPYDLSVMKLIADGKVIDKSGQPIKCRVVYVYWFVADNDLTARHPQRMWKSATHLLRTGELERWAYVSCLAICRAGDEHATYERIKKVIVAATPQFQLAAGQRFAATESVREASR